MIHLTRDDVVHLHFQLRHPKVKSCDARICPTCPVQNVCNALLDAWALSKSDGTVANALYDACTHYRDYTDKVCDTYDCPNCPNYSWCTTLRGIAIDGVILDNY